MKLVLDKAELSNRLSHAKRYTAGSGANRTLAGIMFKVDGDTLIIESSNLVVSLHQEMAITSVELVEGDPTSFILSTSVDDVVKAMAGDTVQLDVDGEVTFHGSGRTSIKLSIISGAWPTFSYNAEALDAAPLVDISWMSDVSDIASYTADTFSKGPISGIRVTPNSGDSVILGTDGHRLLTRTIDAMPFPAQVVLPRVVISEIPRIFSGQVGIHVGQTLAARSADGSTVFTSRMFSAAYPAIERMIPQMDPDATLTVKKAPLLETLRRLSVLIDRTTTVDISFQESAATIRISSAKGEAEDVIDVGGANMTTSFTANVNHLLAVLNDVPGDTLRIMAVAGKPVVVVSDDPDPRSTLGMLVTMKARQ